MMRLPLQVLLTLLFAPSLADRVVACRDVCEGCDKPNGDMTCHGILQWNTEVTWPVKTLTLQGPNIALQPGDLFGLTIDTLYAPQAS